MAEPAPPPSTTAEPPPKKSGLRPVAYNAPFYTGGRLAVDLEREELMACACGESVRLVQLVDGKVRATYQGDSEVITAIAWQPRARRVAASSRSLMTRIWDVVDAADAPAPSADDEDGARGGGAQVPNDAAHRALRLTEMPVTELKFDQSGALLAAGDSGGGVRVWDVERQYCTHSFHGHRGLVLRLAFHPDPARLLLASSGQDGGVRVWDLMKRAQLAACDQHTSAVAALAWSPAGRFLLTGGRDKIICAWDSRAKFSCAKTVLVLETIEGLATPQPTAKVAAAAEVLGSVEVITAGEKGMLRTWSVGSGKCIRAQGTQNGDPSVTDLLDVVGLPLSNRVAAVTMEQNIVLSSAATLQSSQILVGNNDEITDTKFIPAAGETLRGARVAFATNSDSVRVQDVGALKDSVDGGTSFLAGHAGIVLALAVSSDGRLLASASKDRTIRLWDTWTLRCVAVCDGHTDGIGSLAFCRRVPVQAGRTPFMVSGSADKTMKRWNISVDSAESSGVKCTVQTAFTHAAHSKDVNAVATSPNDKLIATASQDRTVKFWDADTGEAVAVCKGHRRGVWSIAFSPVDKAIVTASGDGCIKLWQVPTGQCLQTFEGHEGSVLKVLFASSGSQLLSSGSDGCVKLWTVKSGCIATYDSHEDKIWGLDAADGETSFVTGGADGLLTIWDDATQETKEADAKERQEVTLKEQECINAFRRKQYARALKLALELQQPAKLLEILIQMLEAGAAHAEQLDTFVTSLSDDVEQLSFLLSTARDWNTNSRTSWVAQRVLRSVLRTYPPAELAAVPHIKSIIEALIPYSERHLARVDRLVRSSFLLDYTLSAIKLAAPLQTSAPAQPARAVIGSIDASSRSKRRKMDASGDALDDEFE